ncbi:hypothetical protein HDU98_000340 [Podochytrium sp. JEL0797]|nr:hypothetical protein HDU98_000340 [Podochytrium sp. JEL0797]
MAAISQQVRDKALRQSPSIKNRGSLNPAFFYFEANTGLTPVSGLSTALTDSSPKKYFTVAADMIVFNPTKSHVLMIFRCPHDRKGKTCRDNVLDRGSFQYKGCLATPGGFFDSGEDQVKDREGNLVPDFSLTAKRELNEECRKFLSRAPITKPVFVSPELNNYRDIRWFTSTNYVPTLATQFTAVLETDGTALPKIEGGDDACGNAFWVDLRIINSVYEANKDVYLMMDGPFSDSTFKAFVESKFLIDKSTGLPRNKLKSENTLLKSLRASEFVVNFDPAVKYEFSDFAFDHVANIVKAKNMLAKRREDKSVWNSVSVWGILGGGAALACVLTAYLHRSK